MKNLKYIFILFLSIQFSCIDDKSKFGGNEIDAITIEGIEEYKEIEIGTKLEIKPTVITKFSDKSQLSYVGINIIKNKRYLIHCHTKRIWML